MQTIVSFKFNEPRPVEESLESMNRVFDHYSSLSRIKLSMHGHVSPSMGLFALVPETAPSNWPMWSDSGDLTVASAYVPIGWRNLIGRVEMAEGPRRLYNYLRRNPNGITSIAPPYAMFALDRAAGTIEVMNDGLGYARVYETHRLGASVIATRSDASAIFLGENSAPDPIGWQTLAGSGWYMGDHTPFRAVSHMPPGNRVVFGLTEEGVSRLAVDSIGEWVSSGDPELSRASDAVADELTNLAEEVSEFWNAKPTLHLSGGRDSRASAAPFVAANTPARFHTVASLQGELDIAQLLLEKVHRSQDHNIVREKDVSTSGDLLDRAVSLQLAYGSVYGPAGIKQSLFAGFGNTYPVATGAGGEIARGNFYKGNHLKSIRRDEQNGPLKRLEQLYAFHGGVKSDVHQTVKGFLQGALERAHAHGVEDVSVLDYFYLVERLRRWSNASCKLGTLTPLATPAYIRGAFAQSPEGKLDESFHLAAISKLVPEWRDVPFYKARPEDAVRRTRPWLWDSGDRTRAEEIVASPDVWSEYFEPKEIQDAWTEATNGSGTSRHEMLLQRVIWVHAFRRTLDIIDGAAKRSSSGKYGLRNAHSSGFAEIVGSV